MSIRLISACQAGFMWKFVPSGSALERQMNLAFGNRHALALGARMIEPCLATE